MGPNQVQAWHDIGIVGHDDHLVHVGAQRIAIGVQGDSSCTESEMNAETLTSEPWGKLKRDAEGNEVCRLHLIAHCIDVAAVVMAFLELLTVRRLLCNLAGRDLSAVDIARLLILAFLHDLGKCSVGFQSKALSKEGRKRLLKGAGLEFTECGHTREIGPLVSDGTLKQRFAEVIPIREMFEWGGHSLWLAAVSHHGTPILDSELRSEPRAAWRPIGPYDPWIALKGLGDAVRQLFPEAFSESHVELPQTPEFTHAFAGMVSLADWIASNPADGFFPYALGEGLARWEVSAARARSVLKRMRIDVSELRSDLGSRSPQFGEAFRDKITGEPYTPNEMQQRMESPDLGPLVILEAETGSGKTEAALWRFKTLFESGQVDSLAFVLPTRTSAVQIEERVNRFVTALFPDRAQRPNVVLAVPGYLRVDGEDATGRRTTGHLPSFEVLWPDRGDEEKAHVRWVAENTKRYLAAAVAVGTIDQVLLSGLSVRHAHLRGFALMRSLLVTDEVHASDIYMRRILLKVLQRHVRAGGNALLLSATLGQCASDELLHAGARTGRAPTQPGTRRSYPCVSDRFGSQPVSGSGYQKTVTIELQPWIDAAESIADRAVQALAQGGRVLIVRNTVAGVLAVQQALEARLGLEHPALFRCSAVACPHHGRYAPEDRRLLDAEIERHFGKQAAPGPMVLCGSQTLEQSLDIDADLLITDLVPMDVLLQRIGRLHRHATKVRSEFFAQARVIVVTPEQRDLLAYLPTARNNHGFRAERAYENVLSVDATWEALEQHQHLVIPDDNRDLVEAATDAETLRRRAENRGGEWLERWQELQGLNRAKANEAAYRALDWSMEWDECSFPSRDEQVTTRLGIAAIRVPLPELRKSPFGADLNELAIPAWMWRGEVEIASVEVDEEFRLTINGHQSFFYSRLGLLHLAR